MSELMLIVLTFIPYLENKHLLTVKTWATGHLGGNPMQTMRRLASVIQREADSIGHLLSLQAVQQITTMGNKSRKLKPLAVVSYCDDARLRSSAPMSGRDDVVSGGDVTPADLMLCYLIQQSGCMMTPDLLLGAAVTCNTP